jgi:transcriptional regulator with XRE-family HTH domain
MKNPSAVKTKADIARHLGVPRTYVTLLCQGKRTPSWKMVNKLTKLKLAVDLAAGRSSESQVCGPLAQLVENLTFNKKPRKRFRAFGVLGVCSLSKSEQLLGVTPIIQSLFAYGNNSDIRTTLH